MRMLVAAFCCSLLLAYSTYTQAQEHQARLAAPQQTNDEELKYDDGTPEGSPVGLIPNLIIVNRCTPSRYPATLKTIRVYFRNVTPQSPAGRQIRLVAFARTPSGMAAVNNPTLLVNQLVTIPPVSNQGEFIDFNIQAGPTITAGDFFVGFQQPDTNNVPFFWFDQNEPLQNRGFASQDNGAAYIPDIRLSQGGPLLNFMIRAVVSAPAVGPLATVSAASYSAESLAPETISAAFGANLASGIAEATSLPLPTTLGGVSVNVRDSAGMDRLAGLFFVSPGQINLLIPAGTALGQATISVTNANGIVASGLLNITAVAPGIFTANANGQGVPTRLSFLRVNPDGTQTFVFVAQFDAAAGLWVPLPFELGPEGELDFLILFGTGLRGRSALSAATCQIGGVNVPVPFAGAVGQLAGFDQVNVGPLPRALAGRGEVDVRLMVDGKNANTVRINIR